ncbi:MAG: amidohydrolase, partial [Nitrospirota bacterium]|nr:amidohydrolase [Nitrospirota bacterium]
MKIDMHCHVIGSGRDFDHPEADIYFNADDNQHWFTWILYHLLQADITHMGGNPDGDCTVTTNEYFELIYRLFAESAEIDGLVLLALDAVYRNGRRAKRKTDLWVSNAFLAGKVRSLNNKLAAEADPEKRAKKFYMGASVNPNQPRAEEALRRVLDDTGVVLLKWIPSAQHIDVDKVSPDFYRTLAERKVPLLCHVGPEYSFPEGIRNMEKDNFLFLRTPLDLGVTVIAAHCASPVFPLKDPNRMKKFRKLMDAYNTKDDIRIWADTSALSLTTRLPIISEIIEMFPAKWLVHGSDFPIPVDGLPHLPFVTKDITPEEYRDILKTRNPFDRDVKIKKAHGF